MSTVRLEDIVERLQSTNPEADVDLVRRAYIYSAKAHQGQTRLSGESYLIHPLDVAKILAELRLDPATVAAGILHDTIEDTKTTRAELERHFGPVVASVVAEVTDEKGQSKKLRKGMQVAHAPRLSGRAKLVKLADKISNLRDIVGRPPAQWGKRRKQEYFDWAKQVVDGLRGIHPQLEAEFDRVYAMRPASAPARSARSGAGHRAVAVKGK